MSTLALARRRRPRMPRAPRLAQLSTPTKLLLWFAGWLLILLGVAGLVLPILQGVLTLFLGAAVLSLVSHSIYLGLRRLFRGWPRGWRRVLFARRRIHAWLERHLERRRPR
jgi:hypothetical protein